ncbi:MAG: 50S ribosomal protein L25 [Proteobacteria bacterium]|nr:50S ribosomal protein L25 [Pseudomonadota bacterium]
MEVGKLTVQARHKTGKGVARKLRARGHIPGVCYGTTVDAPIAISVNTRAFKNSLDPVKRNNTVIDMTIEDDGNPARSVLVMVKDYQVHKTRRELTHVDLLAIDAEQQVEVEVPIELTGKAVGLVTGGQLHVVRRELDIRCKPADIPATLSLDISELDIGGVLHVSDLVLPPGVVSMTPGHMAIITCVAPEAEAAEAAEVEGEEAVAEASAGDAAKKEGGS